MLLSTNLYQVQRKMNNEFVVHVAAVVWFSTLHSHAHCRDATAHCSHRRWLREHASRSPPLVVVPRFRRRGTRKAGTVGIWVWTSPASLGQSKRFCDMCDELHFRKKIYDFVTGVRKHSMNYTIDHRFSWTRFHSVLWLTC